LLWVKSRPAEPTVRIGTKEDAMKTLRPFAIVALASAGLLALSACATPGAPPPARTVTDADAGPIELARGQGLEIALPLNAGTGYAWRLDREAPAWILTGGSSRVTDAKMPGAPVTTLYSYHAAGHGKTDLSFTLKRPWEPDKPDDRKVVFQVKVR
jgi:inhibitor of cysteine peptidase